MIVWPATIGVTPLIPGNAVTAVPGYWPNAGRLVMLALKSDAVPDKVKPVVEPSPLEKETATVVTEVSLALGLRQTVPLVGVAWARILSKRTKPQVAVSALTLETRYEELKATKIIATKIRRDLVPIFFTRISMQSIR